MDPPKTLGFSKRDQQIRLKVETRRIENSERRKMKIKMKKKKWSYLNLEELRHDEYDQLNRSCDFQLRVYENDRK